MFAIKSIDHIVLRTNCLKNMLNFYCNILNASIENPQEDINLTQLRIGDNFIDLIEVEGEISSDNKNLEHFCLRITPFNYPQLETYFTEKGVKLHRYGKRSGAQGYGYSFYCHDPQGNEIELTAAK